MFTKQEIELIKQVFSTHIEGGEQGRKDGEQLDQIFAKIQNPSFELKNGGHSQKIRVTACDHNQHVLIQPEGYGDHSSKDGEGSPALITLGEDGDLELFVWSDINEEDATHVIDMEYARESNRNKR